MSNKQLLQLAFSVLLVGFLWIAWTDISIVSNWGRFFISWALFIVWLTGMSYIRGMR